ncbi:hypothetical protein KGM_206246 [Danaus plexippus plexippus]|uniref:Uncharacterized protein n=1 Tax=Danaus plexippus plexippus TaxID=278856 RepID=A0A212EQY9_DANPL|nr:hypothetical protein KGM_206246 [Danaus plexippus plexippus]
MKKSKNYQSSGKRIVKNTASKNDSVPPKLDSVDEDEQGFGGWLRSTEGIENMRLFVIANSIVLLTTLAYPHLQFIIGCITDALYGPDGII